jgi:hypothetical protein
MNAMIQSKARAMLEPTTFEEAMRFAGMLAKSTMVPRDFQNKPENVLVAVQWGREIGLGPLQALQNIAVINGRPSVWGDAMLALVRGSGMCASFAETIEGDGDHRAATCRARRKDGPDETVSTFSVADAKRAGLWGKSGPWQQYPDRMLKLRARGFALRDAFPDVLRGVISVEEAQDMPEEPFTGPTIVGVAEPPRAVAEPAPEAPRKMTTGAWLDLLEAGLQAAQTADEVDDIVARDDVQKALDSLRNEAADRLNSIINAAIKRTAEPTADGEAA